MKSLFDLCDSLVANRKATAQSLESIMDNYRMGLIGPEELNAQVFDESSQQIQREAEAILAYSREWKVSEEFIRGYLASHSLKQ